MSLDEAQVTAFLNAQKRVPDQEELRWRRRSEHVRIARVGVERDAIQLGELLLVFNLAIARRWSFTILLRREEVRRWDLRPTTVPTSHRNPTNRPPGWPGRVRGSAHEHVWLPGLGLDCARDLDDMGDIDHREAYIRFCYAVRVDPGQSYQPPPPAGEQLQIS